MNKSIKRRWKYGAMSLAITVLGVVLAVAANAVAGLLDSRFSSGSTCPGWRRTCPSM